MRLCGSLRGVLLSTITKPKVFKSRLFSSLLRVPTKEEENKAAKAAGNNKAARPKDFRTTRPTLRELSRGNIPAQAGELHGLVKGAKNGPLSGRAGGTVGFITGAPVDL